MSLNYQMYGNIHKLTTVLITALCLFLAYGAEAQDTDALDVAATADEMAQIKDAYGFWAGAMFTKPFGADKKWTAGLLAQYHHITHEGVSRYDQYFARPSISYKVLPWLTAQYDMDLAQTHGGFQMRFMPSVSVSRRISDFSLSASVGLITNLPSTRPTETPLMGPSQGISEIEIAIETPSIAAISGWQSGSTDITVATTPTSFLISLGKRGLMGLSITREARVAFSLALPSRRWNEPGILPTE